MNDLEERKASIPQEIIDKVDESFLCPKDKFPYPIISSQEYGWDSNEYKKFNTTKGRGRVTCDVSKYADYFYGLNGHSCYSSGTKKESN